MQQSFAQSVLHGFVRDSSLKAPAADVVLSLLNAQDSVLRSYTRTNSNGEYTLKVPTAGSYLLLVSHPKFADLVVSITTTADKGIIEQENIALFSKAKLLQEIVARRGAIRMKGDTTMYIVDSFLADPNSSVEDLLKLLPGIQVDKDGNIIAQGEQVQKVLVDGDEFFGDDPTMVTKGLQAKIVERVEVYDDKGELARTTGFDDGTRERTINLKIKKDMKRGTMGKVEAHSDLQQFWNSAAMINNFNDNRRLSAFATSANTGRDGLSGKDAGNFGSGYNLNFNEDEDTWTIDDDNSRGDRTANGLPRTNTIGVQYSNKFNEAEHSLNGSASFRHNINTSEEQSQQSTFLESGTAVQTSIEQGEQDNKRYSARANYTWTIDTTSKFTLSTNGRVTDNKSVSTRTGNNQNNTTILSSNNQSTSSNSNSTNGNLDISYSKKLKKKGRSIFISSNINGNNTNNNGTQLGNTIVNGNQRIIDQQSNGTNVNRNITGRFNITEPLIADKLLMEASYYVNNARNTKQKSTVAKDANNTYKQVDSLSNEFLSNVLTNRVSLKLLYQAKKYSITLGSGFSNANFKQQDKVRNLDYNYNRFNLFPQLNFRYNLSNTSNIRFNYNGRTSQPNITQLQEVVDNSDPLNVRVGNPNLLQSYRQNMSLNFNSYRMLSQRSIWASVDFSNTFNQIINTQINNAMTGQNIYSYRNANGGYNLNLWTRFSMMIPKTKLRASAGISGSIGRNPQLVNNVLSFGRNNRLTPSIGLSCDISKKFNMSTEIDATYTYFVNKILKQRNDYWSMSPSIDATVFISRRLVFNTELNYEWQQANQNFSTNFNRALWDSNLEYRFLKQKNLAARLSVLDALNQNKGYSRWAQGNQLYENTFLSLRRMVLIGAFYNFSYGPAKKSFNENGDFN